MTRRYTYTNVEGLRKTLRALPKEATKTLRDAAGEIASEVAEKAAGRARMSGGVAKYVAPTIRPRRGREPES